MATSGALLRRQESNLLKNVAQGGFILTSTRDHLLRLQMFINIPLLNINNFSIQSHSKQNIHDGVDMAIDT